MSRGSQPIYWAINAAIGALVAAILAVLLSGCEDPDAWSYNKDPRHGKAFLTGDPYGPYKICDGSTLLHYSSDTTKAGVAATANSPECAP